MFSKCCNGNDEAKYILTRHIVVSIFLSQFRPTLPNVRQAKNIATMISCKSDAARHGREG